MIDPPGRVIAALRERYAIERERGRGAWQRKLALSAAVRHPATPERERDNAREFLRNLGSQYESGETASNHGRGRNKQLERVIRTILAVELSPHP